MTKKQTAQKPIGKRMDIDDMIFTKPTEKKDGKKS